MSKNKNYRNYQNYSAANPKTEDVKTVEEVVTPVIEVETEEIPTNIQNEVVEEVTTEPVSLLGVVVDCTRLRVREVANTDANIICEIDVASEVKIYENESTNDFYKVCTATGFEGFCMKKFIKIK